MCSPNRLNLYSISALVELLLCLNTNAPLTTRALIVVAEHCNAWSCGGYIRVKVMFNEST